MTRKFIKLSRIALTAGRRRIDQAKVTVLAQSLKQWGLQHPLSVVEQSRLGKTVYILIAGGHRYEAARLLGWKEIAVNIIDEATAAAWAPSENLHRNELSALERSEELVRYAAASSAIKKAGRRGGYQPHDRGISELAARLGFDRKTVSRAYLHNALSVRVKEELIKTGLHRNASFLTKVAKLADEPAQIKSIRMRVRQVSIKPKLNCKSTGASKDALPSPKAVPTLSELEGRWQESRFSHLFYQAESNIRRAFVQNLTESIRGEDKDD